MTFVVIYDANVLYPSTLRDVLIRLAQTGLVQAKWTETILDETRLQRTRNLMNLAVRDAVVTGYEPLIGSLHLPDLDDRHVLAAAIRARAQIIVTFNLSDFPTEVLADWDVEAKHPDDFLVILCVPNSDVDLEFWLTLSPRWCSLDSGPHLAPTLDA
jgi:hypothetical protein